MSFKISNNVIKFSNSDHNEKIQKLKESKPINMENKNINTNDNIISVIINGVQQPLQREVVKKYVVSIFQKMNIEHLNVDSLVNNVYPKLKDVNTLLDVENQIIASSTEMLTDHYDYPKTAVYILINNLHENTNEDYLKVVTMMRKNINKNGKRAPIVSKDFYKFVLKHNDKINEQLKYERDYDISIFGYRTLERSYLKKCNGMIVERPQHLWMRVAIALHYRTGNLSKIFETYEMLSEGYFTHATPTLFNAGTPYEQLSSCFLMGVKDDMTSLGESWKDCAVISKFAGGIGINMSNVRVEGAYISSTQGTSNGLRVLSIYNDIARYANQGGKRAGSFAVFIEPWHGDIFFFLDLKKNTGAETERARDLFLGLMINNIFMDRVEKDENWSLMCPSQCPDIVGKYGEEFNKAYLKYENEGRFIKQIKARDLWFKIMETQIETGVPYILFKDAINQKSNQINIGVINGSNLCCEIVEFSSADEYAVCNLSSICLPKFIIHENGVPEFDYNKLYKVARIITRNLNNIIDVNYYPVEKTRVSNLRHRPIGVGVQGLADVFAIFKIPFDSDIARDLNRKIFETIYFGTMTESLQMAKESGPYETFWGSPLSKGKFQFDLWNLGEDKLSGMWDWKTLREQIMIYGVRNSLTTTCMPTASTSQIKGYNECIEPFTENIYSRSTLAGDYYVINKYLIKDLMELGLWNSDMVDLIKYYQGSIANIPNIPQNIKNIYRTVWEIPQQSIIDMAADRAPFIDQTQSMNIFIEKPDFVKLNSCLFYAYRKGLKTGMYYLRGKPASSANQFGIDIEKIKEIEAKNNIKIRVQNIIIDQEPMQLRICQYVPKHLRKPGDCLSCDG
ncbi:ribonucleotide reductase [Acanthamoeba polyphaga moumouvirus]|uniref:Ribonucleoside-diphosphate reductase n=1 Tax=Acanthamoeba polyphaga moumouvirus TaxID=1269028 RepID=L7RG84_9VIRU|nr:ribonucleotide reductase [Acanthamoeba polyphaga moumouvirus]AGC02050.1 ribonucleotide reductase large subunit [Acanthamoeba polyphaga moumouvirus]AQN68416.1 ribonucleotide reductase large subunit [Saudi moumouvirus]